MSVDRKYSQINPTPEMDKTVSQLTQEEKKEACDYLDTWISTLSSEDGFVCLIEHGEHPACRESVSGPGKTCDICYIRMCEGCFDHSEVRCGWCKRGCRTGHGNYPACQKFGDTGKTCKICSTPICEGCLGSEVRCNWCKSENK